MVTQSVVLCSEVERYGPQEKPVSLFMIIHFYGGHVLVQIYKRREIQ
jgi:hypothetical protein